ncbi:MAG TPA: hypothetical protein VEC36_05065, partial [Patescibacteria group bacterium]|nr:hypothetical protein [Patescibacteria group bacterium]
MSMTQEEIDALIKGGALPTESAAAQHEGTGIAIETPVFPEVSASSESDMVTSALDPKLELLYDLQLPVSIELGKT